MLVRFFSQARLSANVPKMGGATILMNPNFALNTEWAGRLQEPKQQKIGNDSYEWISIVQKKYSGGGKARLWFIKIKNFEFKNICSGDIKMIKKMSNCFFF